MNLFTHFKQTTLPLLVTILLACFGFSPQVQSVTPAPDGCYPNFTTAEGCNALQFLTTGAGNTGIGWYSLFSDTDGSYNTAIGVGALDLNNADSNTAVGAAALLLNTTGRLNVAVGTDALVFNDSGEFNNAVGGFALYSNTVGVANNAMGDDALYANTSGFQNIAIGAGALLNNTTGFRNIGVGSGAGDNVTTATNVICIGALVNGANASNTCFIGNIRGVTTINADAIPVLIDSAGQLGTMSSSRRFKADIKPIDTASECILALKPVSFRYKVHKNKTPQFGLIAEEVAAVNPDLVVRDKDGEIYTVRYDAVNAMLLNEFLKEHRKVEEQQATITQLKSTVAQQQKDLQATVSHQQKQIDALTAGLQKVSAQLEASKPAPQVVKNP